MRIGLEVTKGPEKGRSFSLEVEEHDAFLVGRALDVHFRLPEDDYVSRHHLAIEVNPPRCYLRDLDSRNGTYLNGRRVKQAPVKDGDVIQVGYTTLAVHITEPIPEVKPRAIRCSRCGRDVTEEAMAAGNVGAGKVTYVCSRCRAELAQKPQMVPGYEILKELGHGGMGVVYKAREIATGQVVAIKTILPDYAADEKAVRLFLRESSVWGRLHHPNIVRFHEHGLHNGLFWIAMEFVEGTDAYRLVEARGGPLGVEEACGIIEQVLDGLDYAHGETIIHRDIKPPNILVAGEVPEWTAKLSDFGLAKNYAKAGFSSMTKEGEVSGSMPFMSREQVLNYRYVKPTADIFATGATLYFLLTAQFAYDFRPGKDPFLTIVEETPVPIRQRDPRIPERLAKVVDRSLAIDPANRFATALDMKSALQAARR